MDPISVTASVAAISAACLRTAKTLNDLRSKYKDTNLTMASICSETTIIGTTLAKIQVILLNKPYILAPENHATPGVESLEIQPTFDIALAGCGEIYSFLEIEVQRLCNKTNDPPGWTEKAKYLWNEDRLKELLNHLRGHQSAITLLISVIQIETTAEIHRIVMEKSNTDILEATAVRTRSLRALYPESKAPHSIFDGNGGGASLFGGESSVVGPSVFKFDDEIVNSKVYRKALVSAHRYGHKVQKVEGSEEVGEVANVREVARSTSSPAPVPKQSLISSTVAYRRSQASVIGLWARATRRKFRASELRFEVTFETPVIFTGSPNNRLKPLQDREVYYIDGTEESYHNTRTFTPQAQGITDRMAIARVNAPHDEKASWCALLSTLQMAESESRRWDRERQRWTNLYDDHPAYTLVVGIQRKVMSWDTMPPTVTKPYATTTLGHIVEMATMLGLQWKVFNQSPVEMRAEGNACILRSTNVHSLGVMFNFERTGRSEFYAQHIIPTFEIKELCWGFVPTIYEDLGKLQEDPNAKQLTLVFGRSESVATTLQSLGCGEETIEKWEKCHNHIYPLSFEIIGILGKVFRIRGSSFTVIPNPTRDAWPNARSIKSSPFNISESITNFNMRLKEFILKEGDLDNSLLGSISRRANAIVDIAAQTTFDIRDVGLNAREIIHKMLDFATQSLFSFAQADILSVICRHIQVVLEAVEGWGDTITDSSSLMAAYFQEILPRISSLSIQELTLAAEMREQTPHRATIWVILVFRMLCWLALHDFAAGDINILPSGLKGSEMPVYIG